MHALIPSAVSSNPNNSVPKSNRACGYDVAARNRIGSSSFCEQEVHSSGLTSRPCGRNEGETRRHEGKGVSTRTVRKDRRQRREPVLRYDRRRSCGGLAAVWVGSSALAVVP